VYSMRGAHNVAAGLCQFPDLINDYLWHGSAPVHSQATYLCPRALVVPDWNHLTKNIFEECLSALPFWPAVREILSEVTNFPRVKNNRPELVKRTAGSERSAGVGHIKSIARRRRVTIASVLRRLNASIADGAKHGWGVEG